MTRSKYNVFNYLGSILAFLALFVSLTALIFADSINSGISTSNNTALFQTTKYSLTSDFYTGHFSHNRNPFNLPNTPHSSPFEKEVKIEKDFADEDEWCKSHSNANFWLYKELNLISSIHTSERSLIHPGNRRETQLFVLYCSWKNYLS